MPKRAAPWDVVEGAVEASDCPLTDRLPKVARTGDMVKDQERTNIRTAYSYILATLWKHPGIILSTQGFVQERLRVESEAATGDEFQTLTSLAALSKTDARWFANFISRHPKLSVDDLQSAASYDTGALLHLMTFLTGMSMTMKLPQECRAKRILQAYLDARVNNFGGKHRGGLLEVEGGAVDKTGAIKWWLCGVYQLQWSESNVGTVIHRPTGATAKVPPTVLLASGFTLQGNHSDMTAMVALGPAKILLADLFGTPTGPHSLEYWTSQSDSMKVALQNAVASFSEQEKLDEGDGKAFVTPSKKKNEQASQRARAALANRREEVKSKRVVSLDAVLAPRA